MFHLNARAQCFAQLGHLWQDIQSRLDSNGLLRNVADNASSFIQYQSVPAVVTYACIKYLARISMDADLSHLNARIKSEAKADWM